MLTGQYFHLDTCLAGRHLEPMPTQHGQTYDLQEVPASRGDSLGLHTIVL